jgi:hypothetical protein
MIVHWRPPLSLSQPAALLNRLRSSTVVWSWVFNGFRTATGLILLPLVLRKLSTPELGMYYVFLSQVALAPVIDFGFSPTILRFVSYAMGGAQTIQAHGVSKGADSGPNFGLLWQLFYTTRALYGRTPHPRDALAQRDSGGLAHHPHRHRIERLFLLGAGLSTGHG